MNIDIIKTEYIEVVENICLNKNFIEKIDIIEQSNFYIIRFHMNGEAYHYHEFYYTYTEAIESLHEMFQISDKR